MYIEKLTKTHLQEISSFVNGLLVIMCKKLVINELSNYITTNPFKEKSG